MGETARAYPYGTTYQTIAANFQEQYENDILLVSRNGKLCELNKTLDRDCTLDIITAKDKPGIQTYERSAVFLMLKAFYDVAGSENVERISVEYSIAQGCLFGPRAALSSTSPSWIRSASGCGCL